MNYDFIGSYQGRPLEWLWDLAFNTTLAWCASSSRFYTKSLSWLVNVGFESQVSFFQEYPVHKTMVMVVGVDYERIWIVDDDDRHTVPVLMATVIVSSMMKIVWIFDDDDDRHTVLCAREREKWKETNVTQEHILETL